MQYLKTEVREAILQSAMAEFYIKGYEKASIHDIAKQTGISVGNVYRYFDNKEALFKEIVEPAYQSMVKMIEDDHEKALAPQSINLQTMIDEIGFVLGSILVDHRKAFLILLDGSQGSPFDGAKKHMVNILSEHVKGHLEKVNRGRAKKEALNVSTSRPIAVGFLEGYFEIIRNFEEPELIKQVTMDYIWTHFSGLRQIL